MKKRRIIGITFLTVTTLLFTACGSSIPDMTEDQSAQVVEYAAGLLLKNDANYHNRLVEEELAKEEETEAVPEVQESVESADIDNGDAETDTTQEETEVVDVSEQTVVEENKSMEEFYGLEGIEVKYTGFELKDLYPEKDSEELVFAMSATSGCKLLILNFDVLNVSQQDVNIDMVSAGAKFKISINGEAPRYALTTMLMDDLSSYVGTIGAGASEKLVLVGEIPADKAETIQSISLSMRDASNDATTVLK